MRRRPDDQAELQRAYREHVGAIYAFLAYAVPEAVAEDLAATTFERVVRAWDRFDPARGPERPWIMSIARNVLVDHFRRQRHRAAVSYDEHPLLLESHGHAEPAYGRVLAADELRGWLARLGRREREVLALRYGADLTAAEIGVLLGLTAANVQQIASRALRRLRESATPAPAEVNRSA